MSGAGDGAPRLTTVEEQLDRVLAAVTPLSATTVPLEDALGLTLAEPVVAAVAIPVFDNSAMDGFAVRFADVAEADAGIADGGGPVRLRVVGDLPAGSPAQPPVGSGEAVRIMTGAPIPPGADAIVPFEDTAGGLADSLGDVVVQRAPAAIGAFIRRAGVDVRVGDTVLEPGVEVGPLQLAAASAAGVGTLRVSPRPRVAVVSTGSELVAPGSPLLRGQIPESNSHLLAALVTRAGGQVVIRATVDDEGDGLRRMVAETTEGRHPVDVIVTSGGVSAGAYEVVKNELGGALTFSRVAMQPGKPQGFGILPSGTLVFGLPGNPVSAAVSFEVFVRPALLALQGRARLQRHRLRLPASEGWRTPPGRRQYLPAVIDRNDPAAWTVRPATAGGSGSHLAGGLGVAEAIVVVPAEVEAVRTGDPVDVMLLEG